MLRAALAPRSCDAPQSQHTQLLMPSAPMLFGLLAGRVPQAERWGNTWQIAMRKPA